MDVVRYAEAAATLLNTDLVTVSDLRRLLTGRERLQALAADRDCMQLRRFQRELRPVFEAGAAGETAVVVRRAQRADGPAPDHAADLRPRRR